MEMPEVPIMHILLFLFHKKYVHEKWLQTIYNAELLYVNEFLLTYSSSS